MTEQIFWYAARATGIVAWVLLTASVVWGLALSTRIIRRGPKPNWVMDMHRYLGGSAVIYTGLHLVSLWLDDYVTFTVKDMTVPMASSWRPGAIAWGIAAMYLLLAVEVTSLMKRRIPKKVWRAIHVSSLGLLVSVWVHAFAAGSDMGLAPARWFALGSAAVVVFLLAYRALVKVTLPPLNAPLPSPLGSSGLPLVGQNSPNGT